MLRFLPPKKREINRRNVPESQDKSWIKEEREEIFVSISKEGEKMINDNKNVKTFLTRGG
jgi:hypothetical protein